ncbi:MAG TPA: histidine kinase dimerization/phospho-acceptor domain-containing protein, partial [Acidimicrobiales bacterium]|nr:histidine kinase dimerization/phospho-acceptor domain-containing protein [Acidimicrobiales bacterium]
WQELALCDNLDIASNLLLGGETRGLVLSDTRFHALATALVADLGIDLPPTDTSVANLSGGQRQLVAVARAMRDHPDLLVLDEPTASLGVQESARVEQLAASLPAHGTAVLIVTHDVEQMFRLADRIVILRRGRVLATVRPDDSHPEEVAALLSGQGLDDTARRQLSRLQSLADQLASAEPSSSLDLIMSALGAALGIDQLCVHVTSGANLTVAGSLGLPGRFLSALSSSSASSASGPIGRAVATGGAVITEDVQSDPAWGRMRADARLAGVASSWSVPFTGASGDGGVITVMRGQPGVPGRDELELAGLYAGYAASALERDRLLGEVTSRNRVLETIRDVLQVLAGPAPFESGLRGALAALRAGLSASGVALVAIDAEGHGEVRAAAGEVSWAVAAATGATPADPATGAVRSERVAAGPLGETLVAAFRAPGGTAAVVARWEHPGPGTGADRGPLIEDAANSLRLALEREESERAQRETMALRSSQELQRRFLSRISHELRTPLTAIQGYASSLMQTDVDWDRPSQQRFLERISAESARLGRLVGDLLDFSAIDAGILRLQPDWCDLSLVLDAARSCLAAVAAAQVHIACPESMTVWADHDRLEQIFVNLLDNATRHNRTGTRVEVEVAAAPPGYVTVAVVDDGDGLPGRRSATAGAGLGLSITRGIVEAHGGTLRIVGAQRGTRCEVCIPVAPGAPADSPGDHERVAGS